MSDDGWEARMAARAEARRHVATPAECRRAVRTRPDLAAFLAEHPDLDQDTVGAIVRAVLDEESAPVLTVSDDGIRWLGSWVISVGDEIEPPYDPRRHHWSADEAWAASPHDCRDCFKATLRGHFGWMIWRTCTWSQCDHAHHGTEDSTVMVAGRALSEPAAREYLYLRPSA